MLLRLRQMLIKEFLQMLRDPRMRIVVFGLPVIQMMIMAFALTTDVMDIRMAVLDMDKTQISRELINRFTASGYFGITQVLTSSREVEAVLDQGTARAVITIPSGFESELNSGATAPLQLITDGTDTNTTAIVLGYANTIVNNWNHELLNQRSNAMGITAPRVSVETVSRAWFNTNQESKYYYVPSLIAVMLFVFSLLLTSIGIVKEKEIGTIEQVMVTPIRKIEFILGKTIPYMITGYVSMTIMLTVALVVFNVHVKGSLLLLYALSGIYLCGNMGLALIVSGSAQTQQQALLTSFLILMPCVMMSGFMFPIKNMPDPVQLATWLNPMRWYLEILRGIVMKNTGLSVLWPAVAAQSVLSTGFIVIAAARFNKTLA